MKSRVFIGSSSEGLSVAYSLQINLERDAEVTVWTQDVFRPSKYILESLIEQLDKVDLGIFVFSADDALKMRGSEHTVVRDNVVFELGLWIGRLGRERCVIVAQSNDQMHLPSDLMGINYLTYLDNRTDGSLDAALGPASHKIRTMISGIEPKSDLLPPELNLSFSDRRDLLGSVQRNILRVFETLDSISFADLKAKFPDLQDIELAYRLDHLRLQMFISPINSSLGGNIYDQTFSTSKTYKKFSRHRLRADQRCDEILETKRKMK